MPRSRISVGRVSVSGASDVGDVRAMSVASVAALTLVLTDFSSQIAAVSAWPGRLALERGTADVVWSGPTGEGNGEMGEVAVGSQAELRCRIVERLAAAQKSAPLSRCLVREAAA